MRRPRKATHIRRIELRLADDDPLLLELVQEAQLRGVELPRHIHDLLRGRYLIRRGQSLNDLLLVPGAAPSEQSSPAPDPEPHSVPDPSATAAAAVWTDLLGTEEAP
jgi:hypothetical protein